MNYGQKKRMEGNGCTAYITRLKPWYKGDPDRYIVTAFAKISTGKKGGLKQFCTEHEAMDFAQDFINK